MKPQKNRLPVIATLMIAGMLLLLGFSSSWLYRQYTETRTLLIRDASRLYTKARQSFLDSMVTAQLLPPIRQHPIQRQSIRIEMTDSAVHHRFDSSIMRTSFIDGKDTGEIPMSQAVKLVLHSISQRLDELGELALDTAVLRRKFVAELRRQQYDMTPSWTRPAGPYLQVAAEYPDASSKHLYLSGYRPILLLRMLPQLLFCVLLVLVCGLAFWLSFRTIRSQRHMSLQKDSLISNISHELKTPVATAKVALEALDRYGALEDPVKARDYLQMASFEIKRLEQLTNSILDNMQLDRGQMRFNRELLTPDELFLPLLRQMGLVFERHDIRCHYHCDNGKLQLCADKLHLQGACYNLLDNAVKYGGNILHIDIKQSGNDIRFRIADNGPGIPLAFREKVFDQFFRIPSGNRHDVKGHGLGLSYTAYVVRRHGGHISVQDSALGGAEFVFIIPSSQQACP